MENRVNCSLRAFYFWPSLSELEPLSSGINNNVFVWFKRNIDYSFFGMVNVKAFVKLKKREKTVQTDRKKPIPEEKKKLKIGTKKGSNKKKLFFLLLSFFIFSLSAYSGTTLEEDRTLLAFFSRAAHRLLSQIYHS